MSERESIIYYFFQLFIEKCQKTAVITIVKVVFRAIWIKSVAIGSTLEEVSNDTNIIHIDHHLMVLLEIAINLQLKVKIRAN